MFDRFLSLRYVSIVAVISLFIGSVLMFIAGAERTLQAVVLYFFGAGISNLPQHLSQANLASVVLVQAVDSFLFALVLLIFSYGIATLFVLDPESPELGKLTGWLRIRNIGQLKTILIQVIIVILAVNLLEHVIMVGSEALHWETLIIPVSVILLAGALRLMHVDTEI